MRPKRLNEESRGQVLADLAARGWTHDPGRDAIAKTYRFADFQAAFGWMTQIALLAEKLDHHPEWRNVWNRVEVVLVTHDAKGLTELDLKMAEAMDRLAGG